MFRGGTITIVQGRGTVDTFEPPLDSLQAVLAMDLSMEEMVDDQSNVSDVFEFDDPASQLDEHDFEY